MLKIIGSGSIAQSKIVGSSLVVKPRAIGYDITVRPRTITHGLVGCGMATKPKIFIFGSCRTQESS